MHGKSKLAERKLCVNVNQREKMFHFFLLTCFALRKLGYEIVPCVLQICKELKVNIFWQKGLYHWITNSEYFNLKQKEDKKKEDFHSKNENFSIIFYSCRKYRLYVVYHFFHMFKDFRHKTNF